MNTGGQRSGATPTFAATTTHPAGTLSRGKRELKKDLPRIIADHGAPYVATASVAYLKDLRKKVAKAMTFHGPRYIQIDTPCPSGWGFPSHLTLEVGRLGVNCGLVPIYEKENGRLTSVRKIRKKVPVESYIKAQGRFRHLLSTGGAKAEIEQLQAMADSMVEEYGLLVESAKKPA
jgi:pyruvate ferredoxin oxidoreductase beta subunit